jgi:formylglycine-generating enzyme required for sulfatase activity
MPIHRSPLLCFVATALLVSGCSEVGSTPEVPYTPMPRIERPLFEMAVVPAGEFTMGSPAGVGLDIERPQRRVRIEEPFAIGVHEVTRGQFRDVLGRGREEEPNLPATALTWYDAIEFCNELSKREGLEPAYEMENLRRGEDGSVSGASVTRSSGRGYRLPSEAEWEYACRAGTTTPWSFGSDPDAIFEHAWFRGHSKVGLQPVGALKPNPWGLHDMHGNAWEFVEDAFTRSYEGAPTDGSVWKTQGGDGRILRGGGYLAGADLCRSGYRNRGIPSMTGGAFGFRVVLSEVSDESDKSDVSDRSDESDASDRSDQSDQSDQSD